MARSVPGGRSRLRVDGDRRRAFPALDTDVRTALADLAAPDVPKLPEHILAGHPPGTVPQASYVCLVR